MMMTNENKKDTGARLSVIMVVHDEAELLSKNLPLFLSQTSQSSCEMIVVDDFSTDQTPDVLKSMKEDYPHLHTTFLPKSVPNPSRLQLALSIGVKAANTDWMVLVDISRPILAEDWLNQLSQEIDMQSDAETVLLYVNRKDPARITCHTFNQLEDAIPMLNKAERHTGKGHQGKWLKGKRGLYDVVAIKRSRIYDALRQYDLKIKGGRLLALRLLVLWKNLGK